MCVFLSKVSAYRRDFDKTKYMFFFIKDKELLEKYNETWGKVSNTTKNRFDNKLVYNKNI